MRWFCICFVCKVKAVSEKDPYMERRRGLDHASRHLDLLKHQFPFMSDLSGQEQDLGIPISDMTPSAAAVAGPRL